MRKLVRFGGLFLTTCALVAGGLQSAVALDISLPSVNIPQLNILPVLAVVTPVTTPTTSLTPAFTFSSTDAGTISYQGDCSSSKVDATIGNNTVNFGILAIGEHKNCQVKVKATSTGFESAWLDVPSFTIIEPQVIQPPVDVAPVLAVVKAVDAQTYDTTPDFAFSSTQAGTISYAGDCSSTTTAAVAGNNVVTLKELAIGVHGNCKVYVTSSTLKTSLALDVPSFEVKSLPVLPPVVIYCSDFKDVLATDASCDAIKYVKSTGAMTGNPDGTFDPAGLLQRDQIAKIALESFGKFSKTADYCSTGAPFGDVSSSSWAYQYVCRAKGLGVVTGYLSGPDKGFFRPARSVTRSEFLAFILRNLTETMPTGTSYNDVETGSWFAAFAKFSKVNSLFAGNNLSPNNFTTRREVAEVLYKLHTLGKI